MKKFLNKKTLKKIGNILKWIISVLINLLIGINVFLGLGFAQAMQWVPEKFGHIPFEQVLFTVNSSVDGAGEGVMEEIWDQCIKQPLKWTILIFGGLICFNTLFIYLKKNTFRRIVIFIFFLLSLGVLWDGFDGFAKEIGFYEYIDAYMNPSTLYEEEYVDPASLTYEFPDKKRNLIYIYLESMETSYSDIKHGGGLDHDLIPELMKLANSENTFNHGKGYEVLQCNGWTAASLVASTSGANLKTPISQDDTMVEYQFMDGAYTLGEILEKEGYNQVFLCGSDGGFAQRDLYFSQHGNYAIHDYYYAKDNGFFPSDYRVWWGYEDNKLFEYAKKELKELSAKDDPFNFTMLTVDTHFFNGWLCEDCDIIYPDQYSNVIRCSSHKVNEFIKWIQKQDFYKDTTIVIAGDHLTMDDEWATQQFGNEYERKAYYTIINSPAEKQTEKDRVFVAQDFYPTTLTALGIKYEGDRVGLGTDLYSETPTLVEELGSQKLNEELSRFSRYYQNHIQKEQR